MYEIVASEPNEKTTLELECLHHEMPLKELLKEKPFCKPTFQCRGQYKAAFQKTNFEA